MPIKKLTPELEKEFQSEYTKRSKKLRLSSDPDHPLHFYRHREAFLSLKKQGKKFSEQDHLPSEFKLPGHPNRFVNGIDTISGKAATKESIMQNKAINEHMIRKQVLRNIRREMPVLKKPREKGGLMR